MRDNSRHYGLDFFKIIAALLVVAIHTSPLASFSTDADFIFTRIIARCAVPFFLMVTGYFTLPQYIFDKSKDLRRLTRFLYKGLCLYAAAVILYLPVNIYAGHFKDATVTDLLRMLVFDGAFYHLWYLPASMLGVLIVFFLGRLLRTGGTVMVVCMILYSIGLAGDSYYGIITGIPVVKAAYDAMFGIFSHTRNGIFYAPLFLTMGAGIRHTVRNGKGSMVKRKQADNIVGFTISMLLMIVEGMTLHGFNMQRHDSMYIALPPCMFFLFRIILGIKSIPFPDAFGRRRHIRIRYHAFSTWLYIIHPLMIIAVRGMAKLIHLENVLVDNSLIHYIAVCILSCAVSLMLEVVRGIMMERRIPACTKKEEHG